MKIAALFLTTIHTCMLACTLQSAKEPVAQEKEELELETNILKPTKVLPGIYTFMEMMGEWKDRRVVIVANHTSTIEGVHLVDTLLSAGVQVVSVFAPEHGFRGNHADGARIQDETDKRTGLQVISLYGKSKKPSPTSLKNIDAVLFDIQDVGARFYTYLSTLHYVMEACAEAGVPVVVLDRPNPNIHYVDGPVLDTSFTSFVGLHPVPIVYGMTIGEYAQMINGEGWLKGGVKANLQVIPCSNYTRSTKCDIITGPSPNLQSMQSIYLYPSLCFFEGTVVSVGRGTDSPFEIMGEPTNKLGSFTFTPKSIIGASTSPPHENKLCRGYDLRSTISTEGVPDRINLSYLLRMYSETGDASKFFLKSGFFDLLAGNDQLRQYITAGKDEVFIRESWKKDLEAFSTMRTQYLIYKP